MTVRTLRDELASYRIMLDELMDWRAAAYSAAYGGGRYDFVDVARSALYDHDADLAGWSHWTSTELAAVEMLCCKRVLVLEVCVAACKALYRSVPPVDKVALKRLWAGRDAAISDDLLDAYDALKRLIAAKNPLTRGLFMLHSPIAGKKRSRKEASDAVSA